MCLTMWLPTFIYVYGVDEMTENLQDGYVWFLQAILSHFWRNKLGEKWGVLPYLAIFHKF